MRAPARTRRRTRGFTLVEVLVALVIVAFGIGAVLSALSSSAANVAALREKTLAQWIALNQVSDVRLNLQPPQTGTTEGDVRGFGNGNWHWQQIVTAVQEIPGLMQITVKVRRLPAGAAASGTSAPGSSNTSGSKAPDWITTVVGFRGDALAAASGEAPDWTGSDFSGTSGSSSSGGGVTTGTVTNPGVPPSLGGGSTPGAPGTPAVPGSSSSGGN